MFGWVVVLAAATGAVRLTRVGFSARRAGHRLNRLAQRRPVSRFERVLRARSTSPGRSVLEWCRRTAGLRPSGDVEHAMVLEAVARALRGGRSLLQAVDEAVTSLPRGPAVDDLIDVMGTVRSGLPLATALASWGSGADDARVLASAALTLGAEVGGASARSLDAAASGLRDRAALAREVRALTSQARASALVMVLAPVGFVIVAGAADRRIVATLLTTPTGLACIAVGLGLDAIGAGWMARMTRPVA